MIMSDVMSDVITKRDRWTYISILYIYIYRLNAGFLCNYVYEQVSFIQNKVYILGNCGLNECIQFHQCLSIICIVIISQETSSNYVHDVKGFQFKYQKLF